MKTASAEATLLALGNQTRGSGRSAVEGGSFADAFEREIGQGVGKPSREPEKPSAPAERGEERSDSASARADNDAKSERPDEASAGQEEARGDSYEEPGEESEGHADARTDEEGRRDREMQADGEDEDEDGDGNVLPLFAAFEDTAAAVPTAAEGGGDARGSHALEGFLLARRGNEAGLAQTAGEARRALRAGTADEKGSSAEPLRDAGRLKELIDTTAGGKLSQESGDGGDKSGAARSGAESLLRSLQTPAARPPGAFGNLLNGAVAAAQAPTQAAGPSPSGQLQSFTVSQPMGQPNWNQAVGERVVWMARQGLQEAQIQLNPRHLGPVDVRLTVSQDNQVNVHFAAQNTATREALESSLPRLREMLNDSGLNLAQSNVSDQSPQRHGAATGERHANGGGSGAGQGQGEEGLGGEENPRHEARLGGGDGAVDYYA